MIVKYYYNYCNVLFLPNVTSNPNFILCEDRSCSDTLDIQKLTKLLKYLLGYISIHPAGCILKIPL